MTVIEAPDALEHLADVVLGMDAPVREAFMLSRTPDQLEDVERALAAKAAIGWRSDPGTLAHHLDPTYRTPPYVRLLARKFRDGIEGRSPRQIWNLPGRYGKSLLGSQWGPTWAFDRQPTAKFILVSYGQQLADENADGVRSRLRQFAGLLRCQLRVDRQRLDRFVTDEGGGLLAAGLESAIVGFGVNKGGALIIDDPFKNWQAAHSEASRNKVWNEFRGSLRNRLDDEDAFILVIHHRVHEDDLTARLTKTMDEDDEFGDKWDHVVLPALARPGDLLGRAEGEPLDPERFPLDAVRRRAAGMGSYLTSALEQQNPTPEEGNDVKRAWFRIEEHRPERADEWLSSWDTKMKDNEKGDYVCGQMWARTGKDCWLVDQLRGKWNQATTVAAVALMAVRWPQCTKHAVEAAALGPEVKADLAKPNPGFVLSDDIAGQLGMTTDEREAVQSLRRRGLGGVVLNPVKGDKRARMRVVTPYIEAGDVHLWENAPYLESYLDEMASFPEGTHDDQVDPTSQALSILHGHVARRRRGPSGQAQRDAAAATV